MGQYFVSRDDFYQWIPTVVKIGPNWPINAFQRVVGVPFITIPRINVFMSFIAVLMLAVDDAKNFQCHFPI